MIIEYHRPATLDEAMQLLARHTPRTVAIGGGTTVVGGDEAVAVVDVQGLGLDKIETRGTVIQIGAATKLDAVMHDGALPGAVKNAVLKEASSNLRNMASIAGALVTADGRSPLATVMLALNAQLVWAGKEQKTSLEELYSNDRGKARQGLILAIAIENGILCDYASTARTPADRPIVCASIARFANGQLRVVVGGHGAAPSVVYSGNGEIDLAEMARKAYSHRGDSWASAEYRQEAARVLVNRLAAGFGQA